MAEALKLAGAPSEPDIPSLLRDETRLALVTQPIVDLHRGQIVGYEALSRFKLDPPLSPDRVFAAAARLGLGEELEALVIGRALELSTRLPPNCFFTLNLDPTHLQAPAVRQALERRSDLRGVVLELTEHRAIEELGHVTKILAELRRRGALIAVDDAGSGYSGLKQILELRPQLLKIDRSLITDIHEDEAKRALVQMLGDLSGRLDAWLLAEGIETEAELRTLRQLGVPLGQGYFLGRPAPPWSGLTPQANAAFEELPRARRGRMVDAVLERCATCAEDAAWPAEARLCVRVDARGRPLTMRWLDGQGEHLRQHHELLLVKPETRLSAVAHRVATRPESFRWDPVVCIEENGALLGVARLPRLLSALAELDDEPELVPTRPPAP